MKKKNSSKLAKSTKKKFRILPKSDRDFIFYQNCLLFLWLLATTILDPTQRIENICKWTAYFIKCLLYMIRWKFYICNAQWVFYEVCWCWFFLSVSIAAGFFAATAEKHNRNVEHNEIDATPLLVYIIFYLFRCGSVILFLLWKYWYGDGHVSVIFRKTLSRNIFFFYFLHSFLFCFFCWLIQVLYKILNRIIISKMEGFPSRYFLYKWRSHQLVFSM